VIYIAGKGFTNKAVSQVIAALLLIAISVAAAVLVYVFSIGLLGSLQSSGGQQAKQQVIMEAYSWPAGVGTKLVLTVRNVGPAAVQFADLFINGIDSTPTAWSTPTILPVGSPTTITVTPNAALTLSAGTSYVIKIVTVDGAVFSYSAIYGSAS
jgi:FlaG/FlaF family flagellin (archaellin)